MHFSHNICKNHLLYLCSDIKLLQLVIIQKLLAIYCNNFC